MSRRRRLRKQKSKISKEVLHLDITSLLDVTILLLFFLIRSYNTSGIDINVPPGVDLPMAQTGISNEAGVQIQVSKNKIWVESKEILDSENVTNRIFDQNGNRIIPLYDELVKVKEGIQAVAVQTNNATEFSGKANLVVDKSIKYSYVKKLMYTCAEAGFKEFKFVVMSEDQ